MSFPTSLDLIYNTCHNGFPRYYLIAFSLYQFLGTDGSEGLALNLFLRNFFSRFTFRSLLT